MVPTVRHVSVEGPVTRTIPGTDELLLEITARYLPQEKIVASIEFAKAELGEQVAIYCIRSDGPQRISDRGELGPS